MGKSVLTWGGLLLGVAGIAGFVYGLVILIGNGNCGCDPNDLCAVPPCPPSDGLGFLGLFAGIWIAVAGFIMAGFGRARGRVQQWRAQLASAGGAGAWTGSRRPVPFVIQPGGGVTFASLAGGGTAAAGGATGGGGATGAPAASAPLLGGASLTAEEILSREAQAGLPSMSAPPMDASTRLQELDALKAGGAVTDAEYAAQRKRILDSI